MSIKKKKSQPIPGIESDKTNGKYVEEKAMKAPMSPAIIKEWLKRDFISLEQLVVALQKDDNLLGVLAEYFYSKWHNQENKKVENIDQLDMFEKQTESAL